MSLQVAQAVPVLSAPVASPSSASYGSTITLSQTVPAGATGTVSFSSNGVVLGTATIVNGVATLTTTALPAGTSNIVATYSGDANFTSATSAAGSIAVTAASNASFTMAASPSSIALHPGDSGNSVITFTPYGGFLGSADLGCAGLPTGITCKFTQNGTTMTSLNFNGDNKVQQALLTVTVSPEFLAQSASSHNGLRLAMVPICALLAMFGLGRRRQHLPRLLSVVLLLVFSGAAMAGLSGCGNGGFGSSAQQAGTSTKVIQVVTTVTTTATANGGTATPAPLNLTITVTR